MPILILFLLTLSSYSQSSNALSNATTAIKMNFSNEAITAYQEKASTKIEDYYYYLELYSHQNTSKVLKKEIQILLNDLFFEKEAVVFDCSSSESEIITLPVLLQTIENKNFKFKSINFNTVEIEMDFWMTNYELLVSNESINKRFKVKNKIYFKPIQKKFGSESKEIWSLFLGTIAIR